MEILQGLDGLKQLPPGSILSIGNFDGIHRGHARILDVAGELARNEGGRKMGVVTFEPHPLTVLRPELTPPRLSTARRKEDLLAQSSVDYLVILPPHHQVLNLTAEEFWAILRDAVRPAWLVEGSSFNFGKDRGGTIEKLRAWTAGSAIKLRVAEPVELALSDLSIVTVSSSLVRWLLKEGRVRDGAICLGRGYELEGSVIEGHKRGRSIGVPTANLKCNDQLIPADGVYAGRCRLDDRIWPAAISIGTTPTFGNGNRQVEVHLIGYSGNLYGKVLRVELLDWIRDQLRFAGVESLQRQLQRDIDTAAGRQSDPSRAFGVLDPVAKKS